MRHYRLRACAKVSRVEAATSGTISAVKFRHTSSRWALWVFAAALLLKAAMPMLASASAHAQGKAVVEVCTVYGVSLVALDGQDPAPASDHLVDHGPQHCGLSALTALIEPPAHVAVALPSPLPADHAPPAQARPLAPDASAAWVARLKHGPPTHA
jgi:hypothetical protein